jgi:hypothetical protein
MWKTWVKQGLLGSLAAAAVLTGCADDGGRLWSLTAPEDYYPEQGQSEVGKARSNIGTDTSLYETDEQERGTGGAGEATAGGPGTTGPFSSDQLHATDKEQQALWLQQDQRVPFPPPQFSAVLSLAEGTGKPLRKGPNGAWIQGTHGVELGSGIARSIAPSSGAYQPQMPALGTQPLPNEPSGERGQGSHGQPGQQPGSGSEPPGSGMGTGKE